MNDTTLHDSVTNEAKSTLQKCQICNQQASQYRCPRCFIYTCSLICCKKHKGTNNQNCNGKRDRASFVSLVNFTDNSLKSDFHFLEDVLNSSERVKRLGNDIGINPKKNGNPNHTNKNGDRNAPPKTMHIPKNKNENSDNVAASAHEMSSSSCANPFLPIQKPLHDLKLETNSNNETNENIEDENDHDSTLMQPNPKRQKKFHNNNVDYRNSWVSQYSNSLQRLVKEAGNLYRNVNLRLMPNGMERRKKNCTSYKAKTDTIIWNVEWVFHHVLRKQQKQKSTLELQNNNNDGRKNNTPDDCERILDRFSEKSILEVELSKHVRRFNDNKKFYHPYKSSLDDIYLLIKHIPCVSNNPKYITVNKTQTLQEVLKGLTVIEFPTIEVVMEADIRSFPRFVEEV